MKIDSTRKDQLIAEWDYEKNIGIKIDEINWGSAKKAWWKCGKGHGYNATIKHRANGSGCPYCAGRKVLKGENDLATLRKDIALEWDYQKNGDLGPDMVTIGSTRKVWWKCKNGHEYFASINNRTSLGRGCPYCSGRLPIIGINDLKTKNPLLAEEWNYKLNKAINPEDVTVASGKRVWWICSNGHEWEATVHDRSSKGRGCPYCAGSKAIPGETDLATLRPDLLEEWDYQKNEELGPDMVTIGSTGKVWWKCKKGHSWDGVVLKRTEMNRGCPYCAGRKAIPGENDIKTLFPEIAKEWNSEKNITIKIETVAAFSGKKVWWKCKKGHEWFAVISSRTKLGSGCPYCAGRKAIPGETNFLTIFPELDEEWDYSKNKINPREYTACSSKKAWWKCKNGHSWRTKIENRASRHHGCPYCSFE